jgi:hypothetical protein
MIINVRGALGNQVLELLVGMVKLKNRNLSPSLISINAGGKVVDTVKVNWLETIFNLPCQCVIEAKSAKQGAWTIPNFLSIANKDLIESLEFITPPVKSNLILLHVRGKDRQTASLDDYVKLMYKAGNDVKLIGDDQLLINQIISKAGFGENISGTPQEDWLKCIGAKKIFTSFSSFTVSATLFDPSKKIFFLTKENSHGPAKVHPKEYQCINALIKNYFINAEWI